MADPFVAVASAKWRSVTRFSRGYVAGSMVAWDLTLACGHIVTRYDRTGRVIAPKRARCRLCGLSNTAQPEPGPIADGERGGKAS